MKIVKVAKGKSLRSRLIELRACGWNDNTESVGWVGRKSARTAWRMCERGDWMLWIAGRIGIDRKVLVLAACACARVALVHVPAGETRPKIAIETAERWARGDTTVSLADVRNASYAAYAAAAYASDAAAAAAAYAAYDAAAYASDANAAYAAYAAASRTDTQRKCADIIRSHVAAEMISAALGKYSNDGCAR